MTGPADCSRRFVRLLRLFGWPSRLIELWSGSGGRDSTCRSAPVESQSLELRIAMRWVSQVRSYCTPQKDFRRVAAVANLWKRYSMKHDILNTAEHADIVSTRSDRTTNDFRTMQLRSGCPRVILPPKDTGVIADMKNKVKGHLKNGFARGVKLHDNKEEILQLCNSVFFQVLKSMREENFSDLSDVVLGGNETLQVHRKVASRLTKPQKEALNITGDDLLGDNGFLMTLPYLRGELGPYIHSMDFISTDAVGNTYPVSDDEKSPHKGFYRYKLVMGGIYKFDALRKQTMKESGIWSQKIKAPKEYLFRWPRYTIVEMDLCQGARLTYPITLEDSIHLYDFHVFSL